MSTPRLLLQNTTFALASDSFDRIANATLWVLVARFLGPAAAGALTLAITYNFMATRIAFWGFDQLLIRDVARNPSQVQLYTGNFAAMRLVLSALSVAVLAAVLHWAPYPVETIGVVLLLSGGICADAVGNIAQAVFIAHEDMASLAQIGLLVGIFKLVVGSAVLIAGADLVALVVVLVLAAYLEMVVYVALAARRYHSFSWQLDATFCWRKLREAMPFVASGVLNVLDSRLDIILLSLLASAESVGIYGAALNITTALLLLPQAYRTAVFAPLARLWWSSRAAAEQLFGESFKYIVLISLPLSAGLILLAGPAITTLYKSPFAAAIPVLQVLAAPLVLMFANTLTARLLVTAGQPWVIARSLAGSLLLNVLLNFLLVPAVGVLGVAVARLFAAALLFAWNFAFVFRNVYRFNPLPVIWRPLLATLAMALVVAAIPPGLWPAALAVGAFVYVIALRLSGALTADEIRRWTKLLQQS